jgi:twitching motility protein PilT
MEIAVGTPRLQEAIADPDKSDLIPGIVAAGAYSGMQTFDQDLLRLVLEGTVSITDGSLAATNAHDFSVMMKRAGIDPSVIDAMTNV